MMKGDTHLRFSILFHKKKPRHFNWNAMMVHSLCTYPSLEHRRRKQHLEARCLLIRYSLIEAMGSMTTKITLFLLLTHLLDLFSSLICVWSNRLFNKHESILVSFRTNERKKKASKFCSNWFIYWRSFQFAVCRSEEKS
jgi:hypothetical protein